MQHFTEVAKCSLTVLRRLLLMLFLGLAVSSVLKICIMFCRTAAMSSLVLIFIVMKPCTGAQFFPSTLLLFCHHVQVHCFSPSTLFIVLPPCTVQVHCFPCVLFFIIVRPCELYMRIAFLITHFLCAYLVIFLSVFSGILNHFLSDNYKGYFS